MPEGKAKALSHFHAGTNGKAEATRKIRLGILRGQSIDGNYFNICNRRLLLRVGVLLFDRTL
jgi:hypothetical protein